jgi:RNA polymerase sigma-70 factor, ECF subfamily
MTVSNQNIIEKSWKESSDKLLGYIMTKVHQKEDAEDILQEVFIKTINTVDKLEKDSNLNAWLFVVTKNTINDFFRKKSKLSEVPVIQEIFSEDETSLNNQDAFCCLEPHVNELPEKYKEVIQLSEIEGKKHQEIADHLHLSLSAIKSRVVRGRELLKEKFVSCCHYHINEEGKLAGEPDCHRPECNH